MFETNNMILIIDDEIDLCLLMKNYLLQKDFRVCYANTLREGMKMMEEIVPDILFLDNNLPDGTGWSESSFFFSVNPNLNLYLMSGYQPSLPDVQGVSYNIIHKPISFSDLDFLEAKKNQ
jgi:DNA-binding NtrC family response regulator